MEHDASTVTRLERPPLALSLAVTALVVAGMAWLRFRFYPDQFIPLGYGLGLLIGLWHRRAWLHWTTAAGFAVMLLVKARQVAGSSSLPQSDVAVFSWMQALTILGTAVAVALANAYRDRLAAAATELERANVELETSNEELAAREEEISRQNEELQVGSEELEMQAEELRAQADEHMRATTDLRNRESILQILLDLGHRLAPTQEILQAICDAAYRCIGVEDAVAVIAERRGDELHLVCSSGLPDVRKDPWRFETSFAAIVIEQARPAALADVSLRPDLSVHAPLSGPPFRSLLAAPYCSGETHAGVIEVLRRDVHQFTEEDFRTIGWLAAQCSVALDMLLLQQEISNRRREAEETSTRKSHFLAAVSHDIRTPANAITLLAELIKRFAESAEKAGEIPRLAADLQSASRSMVELVSDVLDLTRFDSGFLELHETDFAIGSVLEAETRQFIPAAAEKGITLTVDPENLEVALHTDRVKLARILDNLVGNAIKFTDSGGVRLRVSRDEDGGLLVRVSDTGIGIEPSHLQDIFDEFFQLRNPERDRSKGTGLGLAICKKLVDALGCRLSVESRPGEGSTFTLRIPPRLIRSGTAPARADGHEKRPAGAPECSRPLCGLRILLVEDHDSTRHSTSRLLSEHGAEVICAPSGQTAIYALRHESPEVLLLDLMLPDMDGRAVLEAIPAIQPARLRCILAITGDATPKRVEEVMRLGAHGLLRKPIDPVSLVEMITDLAVTRAPAKTV
jgi:signal transduction histidine kinase